MVPFTREINVCARLTLPYKTTDPKKCLLPGFQWKVFAAYDGLRAPKIFHSDKYKALGKTLQTEEEKKKSGMLWVSL